MNFHFYGVFLFTCFTSTCSYSNLESLALATDASLNALSNHLKYLSNAEVYLCLQEEIGSEFQRTIWKSGFPANSYNRKKWSEHIWRSGYYRKSWIHIFVGESKWILEMINTVNEFASNLILNIYQTQLLLVATDQTEVSMTKQISNVELKENLMIAILELKDSQGEKIKTQQRYPLKGNLAKEAGNHIIGTDLRIELFFSRFLPCGKPTFVSLGIWSEHYGLNLTAKPLGKPLTGFGGRPIVLTTLHKPGVFEINDRRGKALNTYEEMSGYFHELTSIIIQRLNLTPIVRKSTSFGDIYNNGTSTGMIKDILTNQADFSPLDFSITLIRHTNLEMTKYIGVDNLIIISRETRLLQQPFLLLQIFQPMAWGVFLITILGSGIIIYFLERVFNYLTETKTTITLQTTIWSTYKTFVSQNDTNITQGNASRAFLSMVCFIAVIICSSYRGSITSFVAVPRRARPIDSINDLLKHVDKFTPIVREGTVVYKILKEFEPYAPIAKKIQLQEEDQLNSWNVFQHIYDGSCVLIDMASSGLSRSALFEDKNSECKFHASLNPIITELDFPVHRQNSKFMVQINNVLTRLREAGIIDEIKDRYYRDACKKPVGSLDLKPFTLTQFQGAFFVLKFGLVAAFLVFCGEISHKVRKKFRK